MRTPDPAFKKLHLWVILFIPMLGAPLFSQSEEYQKAVRSYQGGRYLEALVAIQKALEQDKERASYYQVHARILSALRQFSDAEDSLRRAIALQPNSGESHYDLGVLLVRDNKFQQAATMLEQAVKVEPDSLKSRLLLGISYMQLNLDDAALPQLKTVEAADPRYPAIHCSIGRICFRQARDTEAIERFKSELHTNPDHAPARFLLGKALVRTGQAAAALDHFLALQGKVGQALLQYFLGTAYSRLGKRTEAIEALLKSIALNSSAYEPRYLSTRLPGFAKQDEFFRGLDRNANGYLDSQKFSDRFKLLRRLQGR